MPYELNSDGRVDQAVRRIRARSRDMANVLWQGGTAIRRVASRDAPRGHRLGRGKLARSLNVTFPDARTIVLQSPLPYARIVQYGGKVVAGGGALHAGSLVIPLSTEAEKLLDALGASTSLRDAPREMFILRRKGSPNAFLVRWISYDKNSTHGNERKKKKFDKRGRLARAISRRGGIEFLFLLKAAVTIKAQPYAPHLSHPEVRYRLAQAMQQHLRKE